MTNFVLLKVVDSKYALFAEQLALNTPKIKLIKALGRAKIINWFLLFIPLHTFSV